MEAQTEYDDALIWLTSTIKSDVGKNASFLLKDIEYLEKYDQSVEPPGEKEVQKGARKRIADMLKMSWVINYKLVHSLTRANNIESTILFYKIYNTNIKTSLLLYTTTKTATNDASLYQL